MTGLHGGYLGESSQYCKARQAWLCMNQVISFSFTLTPSRSFDAVPHEYLKKDDPCLKINVTEDNLEVSSLKWIPLHVHSCVLNFH